MNLDILVENELRRFDWSQITEANGPATNIPDALRLLLLAASSKEASAAYWEIENHVFVQGAIFEAALPFVSAILAALTDMERPKYVRSQLLEILFHIVNGVPHVDEVARGLSHLADRCKSAAREGLWILYRIFQEGVFWEIASEIIEIIDVDTTRLSHLRSLNAENGRIDARKKLIAPPETRRP